MAQVRNTALAAWMTEHQVTARELAEAVNTAVHGLTGRAGTASERTVFRWLSGEVRWPQERQRRALETVTERPPTDLGFVLRGKPRNAAEEDPVLRREFCTVATGTAAVLAAPLIANASGPSRVGTADVIRLRGQSDRLTALDADRGGHTTLERTALAAAAEALELQRRGISERVRQRLFALACDFTATAGWSCIDAGQLLRADHLLDRALTLAGMAQAQEMTMQVWNLRAMLARQRGAYAEAVAAARAAQATGVVRRSPLHGSLAHARVAIGLANRGDRREALRALGRAEDLLAKADPAQPRASWIDFYGWGELHSLASIVSEALGMPEEAEAASYRALAALPESYRRNRAYATTVLALAQLHQGDAEQACDTSGRVMAIMAGDPLPGRMRRLLGNFQRDLITHAPPRLAQEWSDRYRTEWSRS